MSRKRRSEPPPGQYRPFADLTLPEPPPSATDPEPEPAPEPDDCDENVFKKSVEDVTPMGGPGQRAPETEPRPARLPDEGKEWQSFAHGLLEGKIGFDIQWSDEFIEGRRMEVGKETMDRLRRGEFSWQDHLDLHGMSRVEARQAVERFMQTSRTRNHRCILIVHGRGKGSQGGLPVLKAKLVAWLTREGGIGSHVLAFTTARPCDGGLGAVYVLLRRPDPRGRPENS